MATAQSTLDSATSVLNKFRLSVDPSTVSLPFDESTFDPDDFLTNTRRLEDDEENWALSEDIFSLIKAKSDAVAAYDSAKQA